jgi:hypothetical protein
VVTANPDSWSFDPFKLTRDGDKLQVSIGVLQGSGFDRALIVGLGVSV